MQAKELIQAVTGSEGFVLEDITINTEIREIDLIIRTIKRGHCQ